MAWSLSLRFFSTDRRKWGKVVHASKSFKKTFVPNLTSFIFLFYFWHFQMKLQTHGGFGVILYDGEVMSHFLKTQSHRASHLLFLRVCRQDSTNFITCLFSSNYVRLVALCNFNVFIFLFLFCFNYVFLFVCLFFLQLHETRLTFVSHFAMSSGIGGQRSAHVSKLLFCIVYPPHHKMCLVGT